MEYLIGAMLGATATAAAILGLGLFVAYENRKAEEDRGKP